MALTPIPEIIDDIRAGRMVILMDDEDRENEGNLIVAAEAVTPAPTPYASPDTFSRWSRSRGASCAAPATQKPAWTLPAWRAFSPRR